MTRCHHPGSAANAAVLLSGALLLGFSQLGVLGSHIGVEESDYSATARSSPYEESGGGLTADEKSLKKQMESMLEVLGKHGDVGVTDKWHPEPASAVAQAAAPPVSMLPDERQLSAAMGEGGGQTHDSRQLRTEATDVLSSISQLLKEDSTSGSIDTVAASLVRDAGGSAADAKQMAGRKGHLSDLASVAAKNMIDAEAARDEMDEKREKETIAKENNIISIATAAKRFAEAKLKNLHATSGELKKEAADVANILKGLSEGAITKGLVGVAGTPGAAKAPAPPPSALEAVNEIRNEW